VFEEIVVHNYKKIFQQTLDRIRADPKLTENNKTDIIKFSDNCFSEGLKVSGTLKYLIRLRQLAKMLKKDFRTCNRCDLVKLMEAIEKGNFTDWTKHDYKVVLKKFYKWLRNTEDYPEEVKWINSTIRNVNNRLPEELLTEEEVLKLIKATSYPRDKALISVLYESGCRIGEVLSLRLKHVQFDEYGCQIIVNGKTGQRRVRLIASAPYLNNWINLHPFNDNPESPLWIELRPLKRNAELKNIEYKTACKILKTLKERVGIKKRIHPHLFRHSRATELSKHLTEAQLKTMFGWTQSSRMASIYIHLSGKDVDDALLKVYGIKKPEELEEPKIKPKKCPRCREMNPATGKFCNHCGAILDLLTVMELEEKRKSMDDIMLRLVRDPETLGFLVKRLMQLRLGKEIRKII